MTHNVSSFALKSNLASVKNEVDKQDIDKLIPVPNNLAKLSNVVQNDVVKKTVYDNLVTKVDNIDSAGFVLKATYETGKSDLEKIIRDADKKNSDTRELAKNRQSKVKYLVLLA